jgi:hypothetical protein
MTELSKRRGLRSEFDGTRCAWLDGLMEWVKSKQVTDAVAA